MRRRGSGWLSKAFDATALQVEQVLEDLDLAGIVQARLDAAGVVGARVTDGDND